MLSFGVSVNVRHSQYCLSRLNFKACRLQQVYDLKVKLRSKNLTFKAKASFKDSNFVFKDKSRTKANDNIPDKSSAIAEMAA